VGPAFGSTLALTAATALAGVGFVAALFHLAVPETALPAPFPPQHQDAETLTFVFAFAVVLPLSLVFVPRLARRLAAAAGVEAATGVAALLAAALGALVVVAEIAGRVTSIDAAATVLVLSLVWFAIAASIVATALSRGGSAWRPAWTPWAASAAVVLAAAAVLSFVTLDAIPLGVAAAGLLAVGLGVLVCARDAVPIPALGGRAGAAADAVAIVVLFLAVPNMVVFELENGFETRIIDFHQGFFLGPASQVLHGTGVLAGTLSQYGVGSIYAIAGWFEIAPIGGGTLGFFEGLLSALGFVAAYLTIRLAGASRLLAIAAMVVAVFTLVYGLEYPLGGLLQHGAIRFGLPLVPLLATTLEFARPRYARIAQLVAVASVGIASIWALEAFVYTVMTVAALLAVRVWMSPAGGRRRLLLRWVAALLAACVISHLVLAVATLVGYGQLPDWGLYLTVLREFLTGSIGDLTYDFAPWSPAFAVGAMYLVSAAAVVLMLRLEPRVARERAASTFALAGSTAYGVALFSYFVNRSAPHILPYVCLPAIIATTVWLALLLERREEAGPRSTALGVGTALALVVVLVGSAWGGAGTRFSQSALAYAIPGGGPSLSSGLHRLWNPPELIGGAQAGADALERCMPGQDHSYVLTDADLGIEVLDRAGRANEFPLGDPWEDSFVPDHHVAPLREAVDALEPGDRILVDPVTVRTYRAYRREPDRDPLTDPFASDEIVPTGVASLQEWLLKEIGKRFELRPVCEPESGTDPYVVELEPRR